MLDAPRTTRDVKRLGLSLRQRLALAAHDFDRLTDREIAAKFGVSRSAITKRRTRARRTLARYADALNAGQPAGRRVKFRPFSLLSSDPI